MSIPNSLMPDTVSITRRSRAFSGSGNLKQPVDTEAVVTTGIKCRIDPVSGAVVSSIMGELPESFYSLYSNYTDFMQSDIITDGEGRKFVIQEVSKFKAFGPGWHHAECTMERKRD